MQANEMKIFTGTISNNRETVVNVDTTRISDLGLAGTVSINGTDYVNQGATIRQAINAVGATAPFYFLSVKKLANGNK